MKNTVNSFLLFASFLISISGYCQIADGSIAPDFTATDINGEEHNLYSYLDNGYSVIINFSVTSCGPCWGYHDNGQLQDVWFAHGPAGEDGVSPTTSDDMVVLFIESNDDNTLDDINGIGTDTFGDWTEDTSFPIIDNRQDIFDLYECEAYLTIFTVCPSRRLTETGNLSDLFHYNFATTYDCSSPSLEQDVNVISYDGDRVTCSDIDANITIQNFGTDVLTDAEFMITGCDDCPLTVEWSGSLDTYEVENVDLGTLQLSSEVEIEVSLSSNDDYDENNTLSQILAPSVSATTQWFLTINTDCWPEEIGWFIKDSDGTIVHESAEGAYAGFSETEITADLNVGPVGCYTFTITDEYDDGLMGSQWTGCDINGSFNLNSSIGDILTYDGSFEYTQIEAAADATVLSVNEFVGIDVAWNVYPNPSTDIMNLEYTLSGSTSVSYDIINQLGQIVLHSNVGNQITGKHREIIDLTSLETSVYLLRLNVGGNISSKNISILR